MSNAVATVAETFTYRCTKCDGAGSFGRRGVCYRCNGKGRCVGTPER